MYGRDERRKALYSGVNTGHCHAEGRAEACNLSPYAPETYYEDLSLREIGRCQDRSPCTPLLPTSVLGQAPREGKNESQSMCGNVVVVDTSEVRHRNVAP